MKDLLGREVKIGKGNKNIAALFWGVLVLAVLLNLFHFYAIGGLLSFLIGPLGIAWLYTRFKKIDEPE